MKPTQQQAATPDAMQAWEEFVEQQVYPVPGAKAQSDYRNYDKPARDTVRDFYQQNHRFQSYDFVRQKRDEYLKLDRRRMSVFDALDFLNTLVDDSDPDIELDQLQHLLQTSEAIRADGHPDWFVLVGLLHDLGKVLCLFGEPQWAVVGDTFPSGCQFSDRIVYHEFFAENPDFNDDRYNTQFGVYRENCGLRNVLMSWGHDEYLVPRAEELSARAGALHDPLPLVLRLAPRRRIRLALRRSRPRDAALGAEVQSVRPVLEEPAAAELGRASARITPT